MADRKIKKEEAKHFGIDLVEACRSGTLATLLEQYLLECYNEEKKRFPNIAGFCRHCFIGKGELARLAKEYPEQYDALCSVFEDEALNADISASLIGSYLKIRLGYGAHEEATDFSDNDIAVFEHDIFRDGE